MGSLPGPLGKPLGLYLCLYLYLYLWLYLYLYLYLHLYLYLYLLTRELSACRRTFLRTRDHICLRDLASRIVNFIIPQSLLGSFFRSQMGLLGTLGGLPGGSKGRIPRGPYSKPLGIRPSPPPLELLLGAFQGLLGSL